MLSDLRIIPKLVPNEQIRVIRAIRGQKTSVFKTYQKTKQHHQQSKYHLQCHFDILPVTIRKPKTLFIFVLVFVFHCSQF